MLVPVQTAEWRQRPDGPPAAKRSQESATGSYLHPSLVTVFPSVSPPHTIIADPVHTAV